MTPLPPSLKIFRKYSKLSLPLLVLVALPLTILLSSSLQNYVNHAATSNTSDAPASVEVEKPAFVEGEVVVKFKEGFDLETSTEQGVQIKDKKEFGLNELVQPPGQFYSLVESFGLKGIEKMFKGEEGPSPEFALEKTDLSRVYYLRFSKGTPVSNVLDKLDSKKSSDPWVKNNIDFVEPNYIYYPDRIPNDPRYESQWFHSSNQSLLGGVSANIQTEKAWDIEIGSPATIVAVIDTGFDIEHEDLKGSIYQNLAEMMGVGGVDDDGNGYVDDFSGWDFENNDNDVSKISVNSSRDEDMSAQKHGTSVAGILGAVGNNKIGISGVMWEVSLMPLVGMGSPEAVKYATDNGAKVINMSFGREGPLSRSLELALQYASTRGVLLVASAGNDSKLSFNHFPAAYSNVISVSATTPHDLKASFSNYGLVDLSAPGYYILSTYQGDAYVMCDGTSCAVPFVSGLAGLILTKYPDLTPVEITNIIKNSADDLGVPGWDMYYGYGRINAFKALSKMNPSDPPLPKIMASITSPETDLLVNSKESVAITGTAYSDSMGYYSLWYSKEGSGKETQFQLSEKEVVENKLGQLDTAFLEDGMYKIILKVMDERGVATAETRIEITSINNPPLIEKCWGLNGVCDSACSVGKYTELKDYGSTCNPTDVVGCQPEPLKTYYQPTVNQACAVDGTGDCYKASGTLSPKICSSVYYYKNSSCALRYRMTSCQPNKGIYTTGSSCKNYANVSAEMYQCQWLTPGNPAIPETPTVTPPSSEVVISPPGGPISITTTSLPEGQSTKYYSGSIKATSSDPEAKLTMTISGLPKNLRQSTCKTTRGLLDCPIMGRVAFGSSGIYEITVVVSDNGGNSQSAKFPLKIK